MLKYIHLYLFFFKNKKSETRRSRADRYGKEEQWWNNKAAYGKSIERCWQDRQEAMLYTVSKNEKTDFEDDK